MEISINTLGVLQKKHHFVKWTIRGLILASAVYGFFNAQTYFLSDPPLTMFRRSFEVSAITHLGIWLGTIETRSRWRFLNLFVFVISTLAARLFLWEPNFLTLFVGPVVFAFVIYKNVKGNSSDS